MKAIVAIDNLWGIGKDGKLLFHIKEDMKFFKKMTINKVVVMGRKTFESLPNGSLKDRINLVITSNKSYESHDNVIFGDIDEINEEIKKYDTNDIFIIGGEYVYKQFIHRCDTVYVTRDNNIYEADRRMPNLALEGFVPSSRCYKQYSKGYWLTDYFTIEQWITSESQPHKSVLWWYDKNIKNIMFVYSDILDFWKEMYTSNTYKIPNNTKQLIVSIISRNIDRLYVSKLYNYYRAKLDVHCCNGILEIASFGSTKEEAASNFNETIINLLI